MEKEEKQGVVEMEIEIPEEITQEIAQLKDIVRRLEQRIQDEQQLTALAENNEFTAYRTLVPYLILERDTLRSHLASDS